MTCVRSSLLATLLVGGLLWAGCASDSASNSEPTVSPTDTIAPETRADSVAYRLLQAHGIDAWASSPYLRFNFGIETPGGAQTIARHLWNRNTGAYRMEWSAGPDSSYVALVNVRDPQEGRLGGTVYLNGSELTGAAAETAREEAYGRFVNDTYWLLAPLKAFDPGVNRTYVPDSSTAEHDVIQLTFDDVGRTPGDRYWLYVSTETGRLDRWAYHLQGMPEDAPPQFYDWTQYRELSAADGTVRLASRKEAIGAEQALLTNQLALPESPPEGAFSNPEPMLGGE
ncbi:hypothetical protein GGP50_002900 [Salinibacter ruber]|jgi:hypothetical protein|uniref:hypothetical protein n=1 Tax=Salinibacter ruber TaxID=146919 RepID=UPI001F0879EA|nr:hypothetical protein [Salinibacter ruber]MCS4033313.1 hypothetical protein [Salinibacter ruber]MCS4194670.1 hypothetical protein [Salinibacter ruber]